MSETLQTHEKRAQKLTDLTDLVKILAAVQAVNPLDRIAHVVEVADQLLGETKLEGLNFQITEENGNLVFRPFPSSENVEN